MRTATVERQTKETTVTVTINIDGSKKISINTGIGLFDHMLTLFAFHGGLDLEVSCTGDLHVDCHHTVEDVGLALGQAFRQALGANPVIKRYGRSYIPMDESLSRAVVDVSDRPYLVFKISFTQYKVGELETETVKEFFKAFVQESRITLHIETLYGENNHHIVESVFKSFAKALCEACRMVKGEIPSTKGVL